MTSYTSSHIYEYNAHVVNVVDGDTIDAVVDLGFGHSQKMRFRLKDVNAPERNSTDETERMLANRAKDFVEATILDKYVRILSEKGDYWGLWVGNVILEDGNTVSQLLLENNLAKPKEA